MFSGEVNLPIMPSDRTKLTDSLPSSRRSNMKQLKPNTIPILGDCKKTEAEHLFFHK